MNYVVGNTFWKLHTFNNRVYMGRLNFLVLCSALDCNFGPQLVDISKKKNVCFSVVSTWLIFSFPSTITQ